MEDPCSEGVILRHGKDDSSLPRSADWNPPIPKIGCFCKSKMSFASSAI